MHYQISRDGQIYGPYTLADLQRYLASGNVLPTDLAKSETMTDWLPVSEVLARTSASAEEPFQPIGEGSTPGTTQAAGQAAGQVGSQTAGQFGSQTAGQAGGWTQAQTGAQAGTGYAGLDYGTPSSAYGSPQAIAASPFQDPPNLHWGLVLLFNVLTCGLFMLIWNLIVNSWLKRVQPNATSIYYWAGVAALVVAQAVVSVPTFMYSVAHPHDMHYGRNALGSFFWVARWILKLIARYSERASLEEHFNRPEPVGLRLDAIMTFFFGGLYFQSKLNEVNEMKQRARFAMQRPY